MRPRGGSHKVTSLTCRLEPRSLHCWGAHHFPVSMESGSSCALAPRALPRSRWRGCCPAARPPPPPLLCSWSPSGHSVNSRGVILGWACGLGQAQDLLLMIFWGSGSWVLSGPPGKLQAYQVRNQTLQLPVAAPRRTVVSGNLPTQLGLIATCHSPGTGPFSLAHRPQEQDGTPGYTG